jgi:hypothetical protein
MFRFTHGFAGKESWCRTIIGIVLTSLPEIGTLCGGAQCAVTAEGPVGSTDHGEIGILPNSGIRATCQGEFRPPLSCIHFKEDIWESALCG